MQIFVKYFHLEITITLEWNPACLFDQIRSCENVSLLNKPISGEIQFLDKILIFPCQSQIDHRISLEDKFDQISVNKIVFKNTQINSKFNFNSDSILFMTIFIEHFVYRKVYIHFIDKFEIVIADFFMRKLNYKLRMLFPSRIINLRKFVFFIMTISEMENSIQFFLHFPFSHLMHQWCWQPSDGCDLGCWEYFLPSASQWSNICKTVYILKS